MSENINLLVTLDENYLPYLKVMLFSLHQNNLDQHFDLWLFHEKIDSQQLTQLSLLVERLAVTLHAVQISGQLFKNAPTVERYPREMYFRLACGNLLPQNVKRVIYLDPDILVINSVRPLWELDLQGNVFAAAVHAGLTNIAKSINNIRLQTTKSYFNSGVLLIDVERARKIVKLEDIYQTIRKYGDYLLLPDQDVMNHLYSHVTLEIPEEIWNYDTRQSNIYFTRHVDTFNMRWVAQNTVFLHFCGKPKPWSTRNNSRFGFLYLHYQQLLQKFE
ncbi:glycosyltransferase family 8 protein [Weissella coleopterorum]|uniref:Glycosyltransferase family 8 protein n=1 Tax=Weissella coleopterorum TaxID=2714949 RepID=A0A6G8AYB7_9LACO|nr:glycosyltransferase family 8 protein [Weissella coleopterorum]QIL49996.1 glycosyltransferase family 8 protein [Weissella coleopterorum]